MNTLQTNLFHAAMSSDPPFITNDPIVNHAVDVHMDDSNVPYDAELYKREIEAWLASGGQLLAFVGKS